MVSWQNMLYLKQNIWKRAFILHQDQPQPLYEADDSL